jgi:hypothetical protein
MKSGNLNFLEPSEPLQACNGTALPLPLPYYLYQQMYNIMYNKILNYITNAPTCFSASAPPSGNFDITFAKSQNIKIIKITLYNSNNVQILMHTEHSRLIYTVALLDESGDGLAGIAHNLTVYRYATEQ